jgi:hypothetical protein
LLPQSEYKPQSKLDDLLFYLNDAVMTTALANFWHGFHTASLHLVMLYVSYQILNVLPRIQISLQNYSVASPYFATSSHNKNWL